MKRSRLNEVFIKLVKDLKLTWNLLQQAMDHIQKNKEKFVKALAIPFFLAYTLFILDPFLPESEVLIFLDILYCGILILVAITTHRVVLIGPDSVQEWGLKKWTKRETLFTIHSIALIVIFSYSMYLSYEITAVFFGESDPFLIPPGFEKELAGRKLLIDFPGHTIWLIFSVILIPCLLSQFCLIFPAVAIGKNAGPIDAWKLAKGFRFLIMLVVAIIPQAIQYFFILNLNSFTSEDSRGYVYLSLFILVQLFLFSEVFFISLLSVTYKHITEEKRKSHPQPSN